MNPWDYIWQTKPAKFVMGFAAVATMFTIFCLSIFFIAFFGIGLWTGIEEFFLN